MITRLNAPDRRALALNVMLAVAGTVVLNGLIFILGWDAKTGASEAVAWEPPGWVVGLVWTAILFPLMAVARWQLNARTERGSSMARTAVTVLLGFCLVWPLYSLALGSLLGGLLGNLATIAVALYAIGRAWSVSRTTAFLIAPVVLWVAFAVTIILAEMGAI